MSMRHSEPNSLPENWVGTRLGEIYDVLGGGTPSTVIDEYWGGDIPWITSADIDDLRDIRTKRHVTPDGIQNSTTTMVPSRTLLVATRIGLGKIAIASTPICFSQDLQGLVQRPDLILPEYCLYYLSSELQRLKFDGRGTTISGITKKQLKDTPFPLPPYSEQARIVAKIEELFSELDKGIESLKTARRQLEVYRQAVLKHAFEGKLTAQWREENKDKLETPEQLLARVKKERVARYERELESWGGAVKAPKYSDKSSKKPAGPKKPEDVAEVSEDEIAKWSRLPEGWSWIRVGSLLAERPANGRSVKDRLSGFPVLRLTAIKKKEVDLSEVKNGDWEREDALQYLVHEGDFLVARGNGSKGLVGRGALVPAVENDVAYPDTMIRLRVIPEVVGESFFSYVWNSHVLRRQIEGAARTTAGIYKINQGHILDFLIPLCSTGEQTVVVNQLSETLSAIDELEAEVDEQVSKFGPLRHAILKKAFAGQLVAQDPSDEPASVLLERIRTERAKAGKGGPTARKNGKGKTAA